MLKTVLIADDHPVYLLGLRTLLQTRNDLYQIVHEATSVDEMMEKLVRQPVDIIITDLSMPGATYPDGLSMIQTLTRRYPQSQVTVITMLSNPELLASLWRQGVHAVLSKNSLSTELIKTLRSPPQRRSTIERPEVHLTQRETEVLRLLLCGLTVNQISEQLHRAKQTVSTQKMSAMRKLGATTDYELFQCAQSLGLGN
ncbi:MAG: response regulator transcription factor [Enterobacterales bacterium endosymbiont of Blomia tropicalis]|uniref:response regulator transcription factor n=1 Tax=Mixta mediterraneensis TaxID=2758443 RepID=UPI0025A77767|nr:response regulator transcription factor [Mixta mediterraneensis]MDL4915797.1 response regulator transcription factor [Mixta mediterraneensis]